jgi:hypothetical protein
MDKDVLYELRIAFLEEWLTKDDLLDGLQRKYYTYSEYLWIIGAIDTIIPKLGRILIED